jgi:uncharacterized phage protein (TIGR02218 family)
VKAFSPALSVHLQSGATTLAWCWKLTRRDGAVSGFTDHDRDIAFDGVTFEAATGLNAGDIAESVGLSVDNLEVTGALTAVSLTEDDLAAGRYDDARVEIHRVNWSAPDERALIRSGSLGEVKRSGAAFAAEVRGLAHYLQQPRGRLLQMTCDADFGDARCGVNLDDPAFRGAAIIADAPSARRFVVTGLDAYANDFFSRGLATFASGAATGLRVEIKAHLKFNGAVTIDLWTDAQGPPAIGDALTVTAGCDKRFETCQTTFSNSVNFRGFPAMPGNKYLTKVARRGR